LNGAVEQIQRKSDVKVLGVKADVSKVVDIDNLCAQVEQEFGEMVN